MPVPISKYAVGQVFESNNPVYGPFKVVEIRNSKSVDIQFLNTGTIFTTVGRSLVKGEVQDPFIPILYGIGYIGMGSHGTTGSYTKIYRNWSNMLGRCYSPKMLGYASYGAKGYYVNGEWHNYQNYAQWYLDNSKGFHDLHLDKDIMVPGNKEYGPDRCKFVPRYINTLLQLNQSQRGIHPIGVQPSPWGTSYKAGMSDKYKILSEKFSLGSYETPEEAHSAWQTAKTRLIEAAITKYAKEPWFDTQVAAALMCRVWKIRLEQAQGRQTIDM